MQARDVLDELALARQSIDHACSWLATYPQTSIAPAESIPPPLEPASIRLITENGFEIRRIGPSELSPDNSAYEFCFNVTSPLGDETAVKVNFGEAAVASVCQPSSRCDRETAFWLGYAERYLAQFLWEANRCPEKLAVERLSADDLQTLALLR